MSNSYRSFRREVERRIQEKTEQALQAIGLYVEGEVKERITVNRSVDTGNLRGSIDNKVKEDHVVIGTNVEYAIYVEKGTQRQKAKPYLTPAVEENIENIKTLAERYLSEVD
jgi:HK97 gp10 family phage protein